MAACLWVNTIQQKCAGADPTAWLGRSWLGDVHYKGSPWPTAVSKETCRFTRLAVIDGEPPSWVPRSARIRVANVYLLMDLPSISINAFSSTNFGTRTWQLAYKHHCTRFVVGDVYLVQGKRLWVWDSYAQHHHVDPLRRNCVTA